MIVQCDQCSAKYRIPDEKIKGRGVRIKCNKCQNVFTVSAPAEEPKPAPAPPQRDVKTSISSEPLFTPPEPTPPPPTSPPAQPAARGLDFEQAFRDGQSRGLGVPTRVEEPPAQPAAPLHSLQDSGSLDWGNISLGGETEPSPTATGGSIGLSGKAVPITETPSFSVPSAPSSYTPPSQEEDLSPQPAAQKPAQAQPVAAHSRGGRVFMTFLLLLVILGGGGYLAYNNPRVKALVGLGAAEIEGALVVEKKDVKVAGLHNRHGVDLAVVRGLVWNRTSSSQGMIRVEAQFKDGTNRILKRVTAYCGNTFTDKELELLSLSEVQAAMQNELGQSLSNSSVPVGQSVPFMVVLDNPSKDIAQVTVTVIASETR